MLTLLLVISLSATPTLFPRELGDRPVHGAIRSGAYRLMQSSSSPLSPFGLALGLICHGVTLDTALLLSRAGEGAELDALQLRRLEADVPAPQPFTQPEPLAPIAQLPNLPVQLSYTWAI